MWQPNPVGGYPPPNAQHYGMHQHAAQYPQFHPQQPTGHLHPVPQHTQHPPHPMHHYQQYQMHQFAHSPPQQMPYEHGVGPAPTSHGHYEAQLHQTQQDQNAIHMWRQQQAPPPPPPPPPLPEPALTPLQQNPPISIYDSKLVAPDEQRRDGPSRIQYPPQAHRYDEQVHHQPTWSSGEHHRYTSHYPADEGRYSRPDSRDGANDGVRHSRSPSRSPSRSQSRSRIRSRSRNRSQSRSREPDEMTERRDRVEQPHLVGMSHGTQPHHHHPHPHHSHPHPHAHPHPHLMAPHLAPYGYPPEMYHYYQFPGAVAEERVDMQEKKKKIPDWLRDQMRGMVGRTDGGEEAPRDADEPLPKAEVPNVALLSEEEINNFVSSLPQEAVNLIDNLVKRTATDVMKRVTARLVEEIASEEVKNRDIEFLKNNMARAMEVKHKGKEDHDITSAAVVVPPNKLFTLEKGMDISIKLKDPDPGFEVHVFDTGVLLSRIICNKSLIVFGSDTKADYIVNQKGVQKTHAALAFHSDRAYIIPLTRSGEVLCGETAVRHLKAEKIKVGDMFHFGSKYKFRLMRVEGGTKPTQVKEIEPPTAPARKVFVEHVPEVKVAKKKKASKKSSIWDDDDD